MVYVASRTTQLKQPCPAGVEAADRGAMGWRLKGAAGSTGHCCTGPGKSNLLAAWTDSKAAIIARANMGSR